MASYKELEEEIARNDSIFQKKIDKPELFMRVNLE